MLPESTPVATQAPHPKSSCDGNPQLRADCFGVTGRQALTLRPRYPNTYGNDFRFACVEFDAEKLLSGLDRHSFGNRYLRTEITHTAVRVNVNFRRQRLFGAIFNAKTVRV